MGTSGKKTSRNAGSGAHSVLLGCKNPISAWQIIPKQARRAGPREMGRYGGAVVGRSVQLRAATEPRRANRSPASVAQLPLTPSGTSD